MNVEIWSGIVAFVLPMLVSLVNREPWTAWQKALIALASSALGGTVSALLAGNLTGVSWLTAIGIVFGLSQGFYHTWWKGSGLTTKIEQNVNLFAGAKSAPAVPAK